MPTIKGDRTRVMNDLAAQMHLRGYSASRLGKRELIFSRERGVVRQEIYIYFFTSLQPQGKEYIVWTHGRIYCSRINRLIMQELDMKRDTLSSVLGISPTLPSRTTPSTSYYAVGWLLSAYKPDFLPIATAIEETEHYFASRLTIESILEELMTKPFYHHTLNTAMQALAAAALAHREDLFEVLIQKMKTSKMDYHPISLLVKKLRLRF